MSGAEGVSAVEAVPADKDGGRMAVRVGPALAHGVTTVAKADVSLTAAVGELDNEQSVLVPFLDCAVFLSRDEEEPGWVGRLALDNVAFLLDQVSVGLVEALAPLASMSKGDLRPSSGRMDYAADRVASAGESLREAATRLRDLAALRM